MSRRHRTALAATGATLLAMTLASCAAEDPETATASDGGSAAAGASAAPSEEAGPQAEAGLIVDATEAQLSTGETIRPGEAGTVTVPSGQVEVESIATVETIPASLVEAPGGSSASASASASESAEGQEPLAPADGEVFRAVTVVYSTSDAPEPINSESEASEDTDAELADPDLAFAVDGTTHQQGVLNEPGRRTYLVSAPEGGEAQLVITQDGTPQAVDLSTGERADDEAAAGYYRDPQQVAVEQTLELGSVQAEAAGGYGGDVMRQKTFSPSVVIDQAQFAAWTPESGWAEPGEAWLNLSGVLTMASEGGYELDATPSVTVELTADGETLHSFSTTLDASGIPGSAPEAEFSETFAVDAETQQLTASAAGDMQLEVTSPFELQGSGTAELESVEGKVSLGGGSRE